MIVSCTNKIIYLLEEGIIPDSIKIRKCMINKIERIKISWNQGGTICSCGVGKDKEIKDLRNFLKKIKKINKNKKFTEEQLIAIRLIL